MGVGEVAENAAWNGGEAAACTFAVAGATAAAAPTIAAGVTVLAGSSLAGTTAVAGLATLGPIGLGIGVGIGVGFGFKKVRKALRGDDPLLRILAPSPLGIVGAAVTLAVRLAQMKQQQQEPEPEQRGPIPCRPASVSHHPPTGRELRPVERHLTAGQEGLMIELIRAMSPSSTGS